MEKLLLKIAVCDDIEADRQNIREMLENEKWPAEIDLYQNGEDLIRRRKVYDIVFLDVEMPGSNGMETAKRLRKLGRKDFIIFLTAYEQFMPEAFSVRAFRYLLKPIKQEVVHHVMKSAYQEILMYRRIAIPLAGKEGVISRPLADVYVLESLGDQSCIYLRNETIISSKPLKYWEDRMDPFLFFRVSKENMISLRHVSAIRDNTIGFEGWRKTVRIPRRMRKKTQEAWNEYVRFYAVPM